ncbi:hypothetical protein SI65_03315 [Aspergillus cristatus]|uniref:Uncharacterized protein n=1 Tax=Aspergillus cristatus TaxID=573508 RepID=A0A1E3BH18_ASPCR|nr:hypothetical protein SI65_03315 [Aspergillus cristatus]
MKLATLLPILPVALAATDRAFTVEADVQGSEVHGLPFNALFSYFFLGHSPNVTAFVGDDGDALTITTPLNQKIYIDSAGHLRYTDPSTRLPSNARSLHVSHAPNDNGNYTIQDENGAEAGFLACPVDGPGGIASLAWQISVALPDEVLPEGLRECTEFWGRTFGV